MEHYPNIENWVLAKNFKLNVYRLADPQDTGDHPQTVSFVALAPEQGFGPNHPIIEDMSFSQQKPERSNYVVKLGHDPDDTALHAFVNRLLAMGYDDVVAWDAGGLSKIAPILHEKYPHSPIIIAADNDAVKTHIINSKTGKTYPNTEVEMAEKIAAGLSDVVRAMIPALPPFAPHQSLDFNDVHVEQGLAAFNANLHDYGRILHEDMIWQRGDGKVWIRAGTNEKQYVTLPEEIQLPLRNFAGSNENMALYPMDKGFDRPPLYLNQDLQASYSPVCVSRDKRDQATVILVENFLDAMMVKQSWHQNPPAIFVCFNIQDMSDVCQKIHQKQPNKSVTLLSDFMRRNAPNHEKDHDLLENFCKKNAKNVRLCRFSDDHAATRLDLRGRYH